MKRYAVALPLMLLAACGNEPEIKMENASVGEVAQEMREEGAQLFVNPGKWQTKVTIEDITIPGMPPEAQAEMKRFMGPQRNTVVEYCLTEEEAKRPGGKFFSGKESKNCRYDRFTMADGKVDAVMRCDGEPSGSMTMTVAGTYTRDSSATRADMEVSGPDGKMTLKAVTEARRIGACDGKEKVQTGS